MTPPPPVPADVADALASAVRRLLNAHLLLPNFALDVEMIEEAHNALSAHARWQASTRAIEEKEENPLWHSIRSAPKDGSWILLRYSKNPGGETEGCIWQWDAFWGTWMSDERKLIYAPVDQWSTIPRPSATRPLTPLAPSQPAAENPKL